MKHAYETRTALAERSSLPKRSSFALLDPVRALRKDLGLTPNDLAVLSALVSFLPKDRADKPAFVNPSLTIVFPSNAALSERANGIDERTLRRCIMRLKASGLIERKDSANGKRFPLRYGGMIQDAFGFDLRPLVTRHQEFVARAKHAADLRERLRSLRAEALSLRATALQRSDLDPTVVTTLNSMRNILRRATLTIEAVLHLIRDLRALVVGHEHNVGEPQASLTPVANDGHKETACTEDSNEAAKMSAGNGQNDRHIESKKIDYKKETKPLLTVSSKMPQDDSSTDLDTTTADWTEFSHIAAFFPKAPQDIATLTRVLLDVAGFLRIGKGQLLNGLQQVGPRKVLLVLDKLIARSGSIRIPGAYFEKTIAACAATRTSAKACVTPGYRRAGVV